MSMKRILIIDDEPDIREITKISLKITKKWDVLMAASGPEGIVIAEDENPDAILLDVIMPKVDGLATLEMLRRNPVTQQIPVLLLTATAKLAMKAEYVEWGVQGILTKPFDPGTLGQQVETALGWQVPKIESR